MRVLARRGRRVRGAPLALLLAALLAAVLGSGCSPGPAGGDLEIHNANLLPTRVAMGPDLRFYVSDAQVGSVFLYRADLTVVGELKELDAPLGVAVGSAGAIYVGSNGQDRVEVFTPRGRLARVIGAGLIGMPNDLALDQDDNLYVVDSVNDVVWVFDAAGSWLRSIGSSGSGDGEFDFPVAVTVSYRSGAGELYVADQGNARVQVFDLEGSFLRTYGSRVPAFSGDWEGRFVKIQSLLVDDLGRLHALDSYMNHAQILDAETGEFIEAYGGFGSGPGELNVPLDIVGTPWNEVVVTNSANHRVEVIYTVSGP